MVYLGLPDGHDMDHSLSSCFLRAVPIISSPNGWADSFLWSKVSFPDSLSAYYKDRELTNLTSPDQAVIVTQACYP